MKQLIKDTKDLLKQATTEKSHFYVASILQKWLEVEKHIPTSIVVNAELLAACKKSLSVIKTLSKIVFEEEVKNSRIIDLLKQVIANAEGKK